MAYLSSTTSFLPAAFVFEPHPPAETAHRAHNYIHAPYLHCTASLHPPKQEYRPPQNPVVSVRYMLMLKFLRAVGLTLLLLAYLFSN